MHLFVDLGGLDVRFGQQRVHQLKSAGLSSRLALGGSNSMSAAAGMLSSSTMEGPLLVTVGQALELDALVLERLHQVNQAFDCPAEPVQFPDHQRVT